MKSKLFLFLFLFFISHLPLSAQSNCTAVFFDINPPSCAGNADGSISGLISFGTYPITISGNGFATFVTEDSIFTINGIAADNYVITVMTNGNCSETFDLVVESNGGLNFTFGLPNNVFCIDADCVELAVNNGTSPFTGNIGGIDIIFDGDIGNACGLSNLSSGTYSLLITDANGCSGSEDINLFNQEMVVAIEANEQGCGTATLQAIITNGNPPYAYLWNTGETTQDIIAVETGTYTVEVFNGEGCVATASYLYENNDPSMQATVTTSDISCNGSNDGSITVVVTGGTPPYSYVWNDAFMSVTSTITGVAAGVYTVTITDNNGCTTSITAFLGEPTPIFVELWTNGCSSGIIDSTFGGTPPYIFEWTLPDGSTINGPLPPDLLAGTYQYIVTDANGCTVETLIEYSGGQEINPGEATVIAGCTNGNNGSITFEMPTADYNYLWSNGAQGPSITGLGWGNYSVTITNGLNCFITSEFFIQPSPLGLSVESSSTVCTDEATATATVTGGTPPYTFAWENGETGPVATGLNAGLQLVTVIDANGCFGIDTFEIASAIDFSFSITAPSCDESDGTATVNLNNPIDNPGYNWSNGQIDATATNLAPGGYSVTVTDEDTGCRRHKVVNIVEDTSCYVIISGRILVDDINQDCSEDSTVDPVAFRTVVLSNGDQAFTNSNGRYQFYVEETGTYTVSLIDPGLAYEGLCTAPIVVEADTYGQEYSGNNFYLKYGTLRDLRVKVSKQNARPGFSQWIRICVMNVGSVPVTGTLTFTHSDVQDLSSTSPQQTSYDAGTQTVTWDYDNIPPGTTRIYRAYMYTPIGTPLGTLLTYNFVADPVDGDINPEDNTEFCAMEVTGSYDPNDKQVSPIGFNEAGGIAKSDTLLTYHIRFQNTGTDTAFTVLIRDTLNANLNVRSIEPGPASHPYTVKLVDHNVLELLFENILLPDSFINEPLSHGFVFFDIKLNPNLDYGTRIENTAAIFFDFNPPIITNTVQNVIQLQVGTEDDLASNFSARMIPNPMGERGSLEFELETATQLSIDLYDIYGRRVKSLTPMNAYSAGAHRLDVRGEELGTGVYFVRMQSKMGQSGFVKIMINR